MTHSSFAIAKSWHLMELTGIEPATPRMRSTQHDGMKRTKSLHNFETATFRMRNMQNGMQETHKVTARLHRLLELTGIEPDAKHAK